MPDISSMTVTPLADLTPDAAGRDMFAENGFEKPPEISADNSPSPDGPEGIIKHSLDP